MYLSLIHIFSNPNMVKVFKNMASYDRSMKGFSAYRTICQSPIGIKRFIDAYTDYVKVNKDADYEYIVAYTYFDFVNQYATVTTLG